ncbi:hypothetical protein T08_15609 [Trichinella sp. T8]|nr:hypothetical protein T08_15609 [Trichinella sp. T8]
MVAVKFSHLPHWTSWSNWLTRFFTSYCMKLFRCLRPCIQYLFFADLCCQWLQLDGVDIAAFSCFPSSLYGLRVIRSKYGQYSRVLSVWLSVRRCSMSMPGYCTTCPLVLRLCLHSSPFSSSSSSSTAATASAFATGRRSAVDTG